MHNDVERILYSEEQIDAAVRAMAEKISADYRGTKPIVLGILNGGAVITCDLVRRMEPDTEIYFIKASSYGDGTVSSGNIKISGSLPDVAGRSVILCDDIVDTGRTLNALREYVLDKGAKDCTVAVAFDKIERREIDLVPNYAAMTVPNEFIVGYGLDYAQKYRDLPYVGVLKKEIYQD